MPQLPSHCLVLLLRKENAIHHSSSLPAGLKTVSNYISIVNEAKCTYLNVIMLRACLVFPRQGNNITNLVLFQP